MVGLTFLPASMLSAEQNALWQEHRCPRALTADITEQNIGPEEFQIDPPW